MISQAFFDRLDRDITAEPNSGCVLWLGTVDGHGYGVIRIDGHFFKTHRAAWAKAYGYLPPDMLVCHKCDVRLCINPKHLFLGDIAMNIADMVSKGRHPHGETQPNSRLSEADVRAIRADSRSLKDVASTFGIASGYVSMIRTRRRWKHLTDEVAR